MEENINNNGYELDWDSEITSDEGEFTLLNEGDYPFEVVGFERSRSSGNGKLPACNMASIKLSVSDPKSGDTTTILENLVLHSSLEWKISQFFRSIGLKKHGEPLRPQWNNIIGKKGRCHVIIDTFIGRDKEEKKTNRISKFLDPDSTDNAQKPSGKGFWR